MVRTIKREIVRNGNSSFALHIDWRQIMLKKLRHRLKTSQTERSKVRMAAKRGYFKRVVKA